MSYLMTHTIGVSFKALLIWSIHFIIIKYEFRYHVHLLVLRK